MAAVGFSLKSKKENELRYKSPNKRKGMEKIPINNPTMFQLGLSFLKIRIFSSPIPTSSPLPPYPQ